MFLLTEFLHTASAWNLNVSSLREDKMFHFYRWNWVICRVKKITYYTLTLRIKVSLINYSFGWFTWSRPCLSCCLGLDPTSAKLAQTCQKGCAHTIYLAAERKSVRTSSSCGPSMFFPARQTSWLPWSLFGCDCFGQNGVHW